MQTLKETRLPCGGRQVRKRQRLMLRLDLYQRLHGSVVAKYINALDPF
jgi:hypothetical protein